MPIASVARLPADFIRPHLASRSPKYLKYFPEGEHNWTDCPAERIVMRKSLDSGGAVEQDAGMLSRKRNIRYPKALPAVDDSLPLRTLIC
jgi:hypothetical protein